jgi:hypothetical protein
MLQTLDTVRAYKILTYIFLKSLRELEADEIQKTTYELLNIILCLFIPFSEDYFRLACNS